MSFTDEPVKIALTIPGKIKGYKPSPNDFSIPTYKASCGIPTINRHEEPIAL